MARLRPPKPAVQGGASILNTIEETRLNARFNVVYYKALISRYNNRDRIIRLIIGVTSTGTLGGVGAWTAYPSVTLVIKVATAVFAVVASITGVFNSVFDYRKLVPPLEERHKAYASLVTEADQLKLRCSSGVPPPVTFEQAAALEQKFDSLEEKESNVKEDLRLKRRVQRQIEREEGLRVD